MGPRETKSFFIKRSRRKNKNIRRNIKQANAADNLTRFFKGRRSGRNQEREVVLNKERMGRYRMRCTDNGVRTCVKKKGVR